MAKSDELLKIVVRGVDGHTAHGNILAQVLAAFGQGDAEGTGRDLRILKEQLVKIAHPVKQQAARVGGLDLDELGHHRSDACVCRRRFQRLFF